MKNSIITSYRIRYYTQFANGKMPSVLLPWWHLFAETDSTLQMCIQFTWVSKFKWINYYWWKCKWTVAAQTTTLMYTFRLTISSKFIKLYIVNSKWKMKKKNENTTWILFQLFDLFCSSSKRCYYFYSISTEYVYKTTLLYCFNGSFAFYILYIDFCVRVEFLNMAYNSVLQIHQREPGWECYFSLAILAILKLDEWLKFHWHLPSFN